MGFHAHFKLTDQLFGDENVPSEKTVLCHV